MKYTLIGHIATGGFGVVEKVKGEDGRLYARKTFAIDAKMKADGFEENAKKRFIQEAIYQAGFSHKNIVPVAELFVDNDPPYFIMPLAEGSLESDRRSGLISSKVLPDAIFDVLSGLEELHSLDIYHRDLKPNNVLRYLNADGTSYYAISDFGLMSLQQRTGVTVLTATTMTKTSDQYTAPEITQQLHNASVASDIYSVGCIIHDFVGTGSRVPCNEIVDNSPYGDILSICTRKEPNKRFKSVDSLRDMLVAVEVDVIGPKTEVSIRISEYLSTESNSLTESQVEEIINYLGNNQEDRFERKNLLLQIDLKHIDIIKKLENFIQFANVYCDFVKTGTFQFTSCDALASRINKLINGANIGVQAHGILALLYLGTSHNRWSVERLFASKVGFDADNKLINRLRLDFTVEAENICSPMNHLTHSIGYSLESLHPVLKKTLDKICKRY
jgi:serine/threonine protein kinase